MRAGIRYLWTSSGSPSNGFGLSVAVDGSERDQNHCTKAGEIDEQALAPIAEEATLLFRVGTTEGLMEDATTEDIEELETNEVVVDEEYVGRVDFLTASCQ